MIVMMMMMIAMMTLKWIKMTMTSIKVYIKTYIDAIRDEGMSFRLREFYFIFSFFLYIYIYLVHFGEIFILEVLLLYNLTSCFVEFM